MDLSIFCQLFKENVFLGDMIQTAISVARNCGMIPIKDRVIIIEASPPDAHGPANIKWVTAETPDEGTDYYTDSDYLEVRVHACNLLYKCIRVFKMLSF